MYRQSLMIFAAGLAVAIGAQRDAIASFSLAPGDWVVLTTTGNAFGYGAPVKFGDGGEFLATVYSSGAFNSQGQASSGLSGYYQDSFYTFCAVAGASFTLGAPYHVTTDYLTSSSQTLLPGFGQTEGAWLFDQYWNQTSSTVPSSLNGYVPGHAALAGSNFVATATPSSVTIPINYGTPTNSWVSGAIQATIWESLGDSLPNGYIPPFSWLADTWAPAVFDWSAAFNTFISANPNGVTVGEMTLTGVNGDSAQPQLYIPSGLVGQPLGTPEPGTLVVWSLLLGAGVIGTWARRRRRTALRGLIGAEC